MSLDLDAARALVRERANAILADLATATIERTTPVHAVDTGTMRDTSVAQPPNDPGRPGRITWPRDKYGRRVKREEAAIEPTGDLESKAVVPVVYAWSQERVNPALGPAADQMAGELPNIVARHRL